MSYRKKLIEVALPLEAINEASAREKSIRHGHPSTLHLWWARRPLAACRAVLFASLVDDPSARPEEFPTPEDQEKERQRLFRIIKDLVKWENTTSEKVLNEARAEILKATGGNPPAVLDPFCGGGSIPLEAQRLGLTAYAADLNPVAVLITKALIEIPPRFAGLPPVNPQDRSKIYANTPWRGAAGLAADVRYYGRWMRAQAEKRIGHLYPKGPNGETVIAWLWARTVKCPNPACGAQMPLVRSFWLSKRKGKEAWVEPVVDQRSKTVRFEVRSGSGGPPEGTVDRRGARCILCGSPVPFDHVRAEGKAGRMGTQLMAIAAEGMRGRVYLKPMKDHVFISAQPVPSWRPEFELTHNPRDFKTPNYGLKTFADLFTPRQLAALTTFSDLAGEVRERVLADARGAGLADDGVPLNSGGAGATAYADAVATYLALAVDKAADYWSTICSWHAGRDTIRNTFARQAIPMTWDFAEGNPFSESTGNWLSCVAWVEKVLELLQNNSPGIVKQGDARSVNTGFPGVVLATDPPYYDNIGYADLADFFYIWLRRTLAAIFPDLFQTLLTPKEAELVATPYRFGGDRRAAEAHFRNGLQQAFSVLHGCVHQEYPATIYYAFKQAERGEDPNGEGTVLASTGWETMLAGLVEAGFQITGTWPMRTELNNRPVATGTNALASSIVLVCRPRPQDASFITRREFLTALRRELPDALTHLQRGSIAPVDLAQSAIGPGMAVFSRYSRVLEADGTPMPVRTALSLINQVLDEYLSEQESEYDSDTRWALAWFEQFGMQEGAYGDAETLSKAKNTAVGGLVEAGILSARAGKVRLLARNDLSGDWSPVKDKRLTVWEVAQHLIKALDEQGEEAAAAILREARGKGEAARDLAYRLYSVCERKGWAAEAMAYNRLVVAWPRLSELAQVNAGTRFKQVEMEMGDSE
jgi:putative DNA methylase